MSSTLMLVLLLALLTILVSGELRRLGRAVDQQQIELDMLRARLVEIQDLLRAAAEAELRRAAPPASTPSTFDAKIDDDNGPPPAHDEQSVELSDASAARPPGALVLSTRTDSGEAFDPRGERVRLNEDRMRDVLARLIERDNPDRAPAVSDPGEARILVSTLQAVTPEESGALTGRTWARLALLATLVENDDAGEVFSQFARRQDVRPRLYIAQRSLALLASGKPEDALAMARRFGPEDQLMPLDRATLAAALTANGRRAEAARLITSPPDPHVMHPAARVALAGVMAQADRWDLAAEALADVDPPAEWRSEWLLLRARLAVEDADFVAAGALFEDLAQIAPDDPRVRIYRGAALLRAGQVEAAAALLEGDLPADDPLTPYWRGRLLAQRGERNAALDLMRATLELDPNFEPALETLAAWTLELGQPAAAIEVLQRARGANPYRARTHLLLGLAHAALGQRRPAAEALTAAFQLDARTREPAGRAPAIQTLFTKEDLDALTLSNALESASE